MDNEDMPEEQPWLEYRRLILGELQRLTEAQTSILVRIETMRVELNGRISMIREEDITRLRVEVAMLKVKAGVWGAIAGLIPALGALLFFSLKR